MQQNAMMCGGRLAADVEPGARSDGESEMKAVFAVLDDCAACRIENRLDETAGLADEQSGLDTGQRGLSELRNRGLLS